MNRKPISFLLALAGAFALAAAAPAGAAVIQVSQGESIQAAIDAASPGDTIVVAPGRYQETDNGLYGLRISTENLRLIGKISRNSKGKKQRVILRHNESQETGIYAAPDGCDYRDSECPSVLQGFYIRGFTVEGFPQNGIQTRWVEGFEFHDNESVNNLNNGIYPTLSAHGLVANNISYGSLDTSMWVAGSEHVRVIGNELWGSPIGFEITVSNDVYVAENTIYNNTIGVGLFHPNAAGNPPKPVMRDWIIENNQIFDNNLPNPAPASTFQGGLPAGIGVLVLGVSDHEVRNNRVEENDLVGIGLLDWCTATAIGDPGRNCSARPPIAVPEITNVRVEDNYLRDNGQDPNFPIIPGSDILFLHLPIETAVGNCVQNNGPPGIIEMANTPDGLMPTDGC